MLTAVAQSGGVNVDTITDFATSADKLQFTLDYSAQTVGVVVNATVTTAAAGITDSQASLTGERGQYIYDTTNSKLYVNVNNDNLITALDYTVNLNAATVAANSILTGDMNFVITGGSGLDTITAGGGNDVFVYNQNGTTSGTLAGTTNAVIDLVNGGGGSADAIQLDGTIAQVIPSTLVLSRITNVEKITSAVNTNAVSITLIAASTNATSFNFIDLSGDTSSTGTNVISVTGAGGISSITGSAGIDQITLGALATAVTVTGGAGADTLSVANVSQTTVADTDGIDITVSAGTVSLITTTTALTATTITGGTGVDTITLAGGESNVATITGGGGIDAINLGAAHTGGVRVDLSGIVAVVNRDAVTNFVTLVDKVGLGAAQTSLGTAAAAAPIVTTSTTAASAGGGAYALTGVASNTADVIILNVAASTGAGDLLLGTTIGTTLLAALSSNATAHTAITAVASTIGYILAVQGGNSYLYHYINDGDTSLVAAEILLVGTFTGTTLVAADFGVLVA